MKKRIFYIALIVICLSIITGGTLSFYATSSTARNVITSADVEVNVVEQQLVNGALVDYPTGSIDVLPTAKVSKIVSAQNAEQPAWVRMSYSVSVYDAKGVKMDIPADELAKVVLISPDESSWTYSDGWWYWENALDAGETTAPLFSEVAFAGAEMDNKYQLCTVNVDVVAQAVQKAHNGESVWEALGWPEA